MEGANLNKNEEVKKVENSQQEKSFKGYGLGKIENLLEEKSIKEIELYFENIIDLLDKRAVEIQNDWVSFDANYCKSDNSFCFCKLHLTSEEEKIKNDSFKSTYKILGKELMNGFTMKEGKRSRTLPQRPQILLKPVKSDMKSQSLPYEDRFRNFITSEDELDEGIPQISFGVGSLGKVLLDLNDGETIIFKDFAIEFIPEKEEGPHCDECVKLIKDHEEIKKAINKKIEKTKIKIIELQDKLNNDLELLR